MGLLAPDGREIAVAHAAARARRAGLRVRGHRRAARAQPVARLLRAGAAVRHDAERLRFLAAHDTDPFVRWDQPAAIRDRADAGPGRDLSARRRAGARRGAGRGDGRHPGPRRCRPGLRRRGVGAAEPQLCRQPDGDRGLAGDPRACARRCGRRSATRLGAALRATYERLADAGPYRIDGASIGRRALAQRLPVIWPPPARTAWRWPGRSSRHRPT